MTREVVRRTSLFVCDRSKKGYTEFKASWGHSTTGNPKDQPEYLEICHNISQTDKDTDDLPYILQGRSDRSKTKVELNTGNLMTKMGSENIV